MRIGKVHRGASRTVAALFVAGLVSGCSSDVLRFSDDPLGNPYRARGADGLQTGSVSSRAIAPVQTAAVPDVTTQPLPPPLRTGTVAASSGSAASNLAPSNLAPSGAAPRVASLGAGGSGIAGGAAGWTAAGGTPVTLQQGETVSTLSDRYGVPVSALLSVNGLSSASQAVPGQQIIIPSYNAVSGGRPIVPTRAASPVLKEAQAAAKSPRTTVQTASLGTAASASSKSILKRPGADEDDDQDDRKQVLPRASTPANAPKVAAKPVDSVPAAKEAVKAAAPIAPRQVRKIDMAAPRQSLPPKSEETTSIGERPAAARDLAARTTERKVVQPVYRDPPKVEPAQAPAEPAEDKGTGEFRWPARGRVIAGFGSKAAGGGNDGINIAVPEGTPVKAAEGGTVVHADDRLKGYGKLVLIRHDNGYVSAYAHNGELNVKRGDAVKRGQIIAKSGQSGNVTSPQLHFELRKGSTPVDPMKMLEN